MKPGWNHRVRCRNDLKTLENGLGGRDRLDFGTVRPRVQIPGPRPTNLSVKGPRQPSRDNPRATRLLADSWQIVVATVWRRALNRTGCRLPNTVRWWALVIVVTVAIACGTTEGPVRLAKGSPPSSVAESPTPPPVQPIALSGKNSKVTNPINVPPGNYRISWQASGSSNFVVYIQGQDKDLLVNEILPSPNHGEVLFTSAGGQFIIEVKASQATWKITFTWLSP
jgi:hypothetical protein